jgi:flagellar biosynthetic protein FliP
VNLGPLVAIAHQHKAGMPLDLLAGLTLVAIVPFLLVTTTSFIRIVVVLSLVRSAIGASSLPPNAVLTGVALLLSAAIMAPTMRAIQREAIVPYAHGRISQTQMFTKAFAPLRDFMLRQTHRRDLALFSRIAQTHDGEGTATNPTVLIPAFVVGELRSAFAIGLALYLPFVAIDLAVASILMGLGMFMLSPPIVSLPCKLLLFVMVDGWALVCGGVVSTFR